MKCSKRHIQKRLGDYLTGHLDPAAQTEVKNHLAECQDCRTSLALMEKMAGIQAGSSSPHPDYALIAQYYSSPETLDEATIRDFEEHLHQCDECAYELNFLRETEGDLEKYAATVTERPSALESIASFLSGFLRKPALAYFLLLLTAYPTYVWLTGGPAGDVEEVFQLQQMSRDGGEVPLVDVDRTKPTTILNLPYAPFPEEYSYSVSLSDPDLTRTIEVPVIVDATDSSSITIVLDLRSMESGSYVLILREQSQVDRDDYVELLFPFDLQIE